MSKKKELEKNADAVLASVDNTATPVEKFCMLWTGTIRPVLELLKSITGHKIDEQIEKLERAADNLCNGTNPDVENYCKVWNSLHLKSILKMVQIFTGPKVDKAINKFIEISDDLCG